MTEHEFAVSLTLRQGMEFGVRFDDANLPVLTMDEPAPVGDNEGPNATRVLAAAIGNCLGASLLFCLRRAHIEVRGLEVRVRGTLTRNERGRLRIAKIDVRLDPDVSPEARTRMGRCLELFEEFCIVTQSVRGGIDVEVDVAAPAPAIV